MEIVVKDGAFENEHFTKKARELADFVTGKLKLSFDDVEFRLVDNDTLAEEMALYGDPLPTWYTGQEYIRARRELLGLHASLYEMVGHTQTDQITGKTRTIVYLNKGDTEAEILSVISHVYGHLHVQKNNFVAKGSTQNLSKHNYYRRRYRALEEIVGAKEVADVYDTGQTLSSLIDLYPDFRVDEKDAYYTKSPSVPIKDDYNVFDFLMTQANIPDWQREVFGIVRDIYSLMKMARIKIIHEGFATFVEEKCALEIGKTDPKLGLTLVDHLRAVADPLNTAQLPYALGWRALKDIESRWNEGKHGLEYEMLSREEKLTYKREENKGIDKVLQVIELDDDWKFLFSYATKDFLEKYLQETMDALENIYSTQLSKEEREDMLPDILLGFIEDQDPDELRFQLLHRSESYLPSVYIPAGGFNYVPKNGRFRGMLLKEDLSLLNRYVKSTDEKQKKEELEEVKQRFAPYLTLNNDTTYRAMHRIARLIKKPVYMETIDEDGQGLLLVSDGKDIDFLEPDDAE